MIFNNILELYNYAVICPFCNSTRKLSLTFSDTNYVVNDFTINSQTLTINGSYKNYLNFTYIIDIMTGMIESKHPQNVLTVLALAIDSNCHCSEFLSRYIYLSSSRIINIECYSESLSFSKYKLEFKNNEVNCYINHNIVDLSIDLTKLDLSDLNKLEKKLNYLLVFK